MSRYTYGDSETAAERLELVARLFEPTSRSFLAASVGTPAPNLALDLGCGPGHTTALVHAVSGAARTVGLDRSSAFAHRARVTAPLGVAFVAADVAAPALPTGPAGLIYARLLLAHLADPRALVRRWSTQLTIGGRILIDDLETIDTREGVFRAYLDDVALTVVRAQGGVLFVGPVLHTARDPSGLARVHDEVATFTAPAAETARVFGMNLAVLTERGEIRPRPEMADALGAIAGGAQAAAPVGWSVRQLAWRRTG